MIEPKIRFKGFEGEWKTSKIGELAPLSNGYAFQSNQFSSNGIPIVRISNIQDTGIVGGDFTKYIEFHGDSEFRLFDGDAVIAMSGATTGKVAVVQTQKFLYQNQRVGKFIRTDKVNYSLLTTFVKSHRFRADLSCLLASSAQPNASSKDIESISLNLPVNQEEQQLLASYFTSLDSQITAATSRLASLKQMKAASLQAMFPQQGETVPKVRFKGFEGEWKWLKLGSISEKVKRKAPINSVAPIMMISALNGFINQSEKYSDNNAGSSLVNYTLLKKGELSYNHGYSKTRNFGSCFNLHVDEARIPFVYHSFRLLNNNNSFFYAYYLNSGIKDKELKRMVSSTARMDGLLNISFNDYMELSVPQPPKAEQQAIANYFTSLDRQITLQTQRLEKLKQIKAACLDKMFV